MHAHGPISTRSCKYQDRTGCSLVSVDTQEIGNLTNRRDYLINQGFNFQVLTAQRVRVRVG